jgi:hypothetical protein
MPDRYAPLGRKLGLEQMHLPLLTLFWLVLLLLGPQDGILDLTGGSETQPL